MGILDNYSHSGATVEGSKQKLKDTLGKWYTSQESHQFVPRIEAPRLAVPRDILSNGPTPQAHTASKCAFPSVQEMALFASHDSFGVVDLGA